MKAAWFRWISPIEAHLWWAYNEELLQEFKTLIFAGCRKWDPEQRVWVVTGAEWCTIAEEWFRRHFGPDFQQSSWWDEPQSPPPPPPPPPPPKSPPPPSAMSDWDVLYLRSGAPAGLVEVAYRWWAMRAHPDRGGSTEAMQRINAAHERLKRSVR